MALYALVKSTVALVHVVLLGHLVCTTVRHIVIVTNALFLLFQPLYPCSPAGRLDLPARFRFFFFGLGFGCGFFGGPSSSSGALRLTAAAVDCPAGSGSKWKATDGDMYSSSRAKSTGKSPLRSARKSDLTLSATLVQSSRSARKMASIDAAL